VEDVSLKPVDVFDIGDVLGVEHARCNNHAAKGPAFFGTGLCVFGKNFPYSTFLITLDMID
ncbi:hypothetical protein NL320_27280, partial [Klebsiella pneumoniae]|nr:hypothetical protein [Klebsiella pneumoniae]